MTNKPTLEEEIGKIIEEFSWGLVCNKCGGGGMNHEIKEVCGQCKGTGIYDWRHDLSTKKIVELLNTKLDQVGSEFKQELIEYSKELSAGNIYKEGSGTRWGIVAGEAAMFNGAEMIIDQIITRHKGI